MKNAFTMIELIFVVVVLGLLAAVALPRFGHTKNMADISKGRSDVAAIRSAILTERQSRLIRGVSGYVSKLCTDGADDPLFTGSGENDRGRLLQYGIVPSSSSGGWENADGCTKFKFHATEGTTVIFTYNSKTGSFTCKRDAGGEEGKICKQMID